jgi:uncharacterized protein
MKESIREKLDMFKGFSGNAVKTSGRSPGPGSVTEGTVQSNSHGSCLVVEHDYPLTYVHGGYALEKALCHDACYVRLLNGGSESSERISDYVFLDIETTGLSGGAGTVAFLTGVGFFKGTSFIVRQYFMRDYDDEPAMLDFLDEILKERQGLVTFNGKSFDWNILRSRFVFNRMKPAVCEPVHIDLLYPSRRIWKLKLENCRLSSLEENILGEYRVDDIPGELIPSAYFEYLDTGRFDKIRKVMDHNRADILSMVSLLTKVCTILRDPVYESDGGFELLGAGSIFETADNAAKVIECLEACINSESSQIRHSALMKLSVIYKRGNEYEKAVNQWKEHSGCVYCASTRIYSMIELAKYYEHKEKDILSALKVTEEAISYMSASLRRGGDDAADLKKRHERLKKKTWTKM